jgi:hypothetical protein
MAASSPTAVTVGVGRVRVPAGQGITVVVSRVTVVVAVLPHSSEGLTPPLRGVVVRGRVTPPWRLPRRTPSLTWLVSGALPGLLVARRAPSRVEVVREAPARRTGWSTGLLRTPVRILVGSGIVSFCLVAQLFPPGFAAPPRIPRRFRSVPRRSSIGQRPVPRRSGFGLRPIPGRSRAGTQTIPRGWFLRSGLRTRPRRPLIRRRRLRPSRVATRSTPLRCGLASTSSPGRRAGRWRPGPPVLVVRWAGIAWMLRWHGHSPFLPPVGMETIAAGTTPESDRDSSS